MENRKYTIKISKRTPVFEESISNLTYNGKVQTLNAKNFVRMVQRVVLLEPVTKRF